MKKSLRYQARYLLQYLGVTALVYLGCIFYMMLIRSGSGTARFSMMSFELCLYFELILFSFLYTCIFNSSYLSSALEFGATRQGWFKAMLVFKAAYVLGSLALAGAVVPIASWFFKQPSVWGISFFPLLGAAALLVASIGSLLGILSARFGAKCMVIGILGGILLVLAGVLGFVFLGTEELFMGVVRSVWLPVLLVALCLPAELCNWLAVRGTAVKG